ncbi:MAG TPA: hypothetical protein VG477_04490 [Thermoanaerobaculia bacterium]|nr:hypothetical protein [Thermoanaerobaculia bacterium]
MKRSGRRIFDNLELGLATLAAGNPRWALNVAGALGRLRNRLSRRWPSPEQIQSLFPHLERDAAARVAWSIGGLEARNRLLVSCMLREGLEPVRPLVRLPAFGALRPPLILGTFHVGAMHALGPALEQLPGPVLALRHGPMYAPRPPVELATTEGDSQRRAAVFQKMLARLEGGGFVAAALDVAPGASLRVPCLGRTLTLARGPFALARITGTPVVPLVARWRGDEVEVETGPPLGPGDSEIQMAEAAGSWLERYLLASPAETGLALVRNLLLDEIL